MIASWTHGLGRPYGRCMSDTKTVIITGSSSGIGLHLAHTFVKRGANVIINGRDAGRLGAAQAELAAPDRVAVVRGDIGDARTGAELARVAVERFGRVDVLVNSAGTFAPKPFVDVTEAELDGYLAGNLKGTFLTTQSIVRAMAASATGG